MNSCHKVASELKRIANRLSARHGGLESLWENGRNAVVASVSTPWGAADSSTPVCRGCVYYSTARHGGFSVSKTLAKHLSQYAKKVALERNGTYWFEEDCAYAIALYELSQKVGGFTKALADTFPSMTEGRLRKVVEVRYKDYEFED